MTERLGFTVKQAAALLGVSQQTVYRAIDRGDITVVRMSNRIVIPARQLYERFGMPVEVQA